MKGTPDRNSTPPAMANAEAVFISDSPLCGFLQSNPFEKPFRYAINPTLPATSPAPIKIDPIVFCLLAFSDNLLL